jgi:glc operon protein GlcG
MTLTRKEARVLIDTAAEKGEELGMKPAIAVVDASGRLVSLDQTDGALPNRDRMAKGKAFAAITLGQNTHEALEMIETKPHRYHGLVGMFPGEIYISGGGVLLEADGEVVGAIGIAGGKHGTDEQMAEAAIAAWLEVRKELG